ncbi:prolyl 3-hydroxylase OGFOD1-like [Symsagittifera roscoffensis]|uniref:prolyl 3-hydroxylase OGFOD1-like n=1 Tax=Symsagittifera roscoffensis TaxID=84072 RepID=UPI00307B9E18
MAQNKPFFIENFSSRVEIANTCLSDGVDYTDRHITIQSSPFRHLLLHSLLDESFFSSVKSELLQLRFHPKECDLFKLKQTRDFGKYPEVDCLDEESASLKRFLDLVNNDLKSWICSVFNVKLNGLVSVSGSIYNQTDYLLCHDDKLEGRKIAFIFYLVDEDWSGNEDGGCLRLFSSDHNFVPCGLPSKIIAPVSNTFVMFEVVPGSYHDVSEVLTNRSPRLAISGWFHSSEPSARDDHLRAPLRLGHDMQLCEDDIDFFVNCINECYTDQTDIDRIVQIRQVFEDESILELDKFFSNEFIQNLMRSEADFKFPTSQCPVFERFKTLCSDSVLFASLKRLVTHEMMFALLCQLTGVEMHPESASLLSFEESQLGSHASAEKKYRCEFELRKVERSSYSVLTDDAEVMNKNSSNGTETELPNGGSFENLQESQQKVVNLDFGSGLDEEIDVFSLHLHAFFLPKNGVWDEDWGGFIVYVDEEGQEIQRLTPKHNCLTLAYVDSKTKSFLKYSNCLGGDNFYYHLMCRFYVER